MEERERGKKGKRKELHCGLLCIRVRIVFVGAGNMARD